MCFTGDDLHKLLGFPQLLLYRKKKNPACIEKNVLLLNVSLAGGVNISQFDKKFQDFLPYFEEYSQLKVLLRENSNLHFLNIPLLFLLLFLELICSLAFSM